MLSETSIIILNYTRYSDSSIIVNALSEKYGRIAFIVYGIGGKHRAKLSAFQPLYMLDIQVYHKASKGLHKLKEYKINPPLYNLSANIRKSTLALFIAELLSKTIKEEFADKSLFDFIKTSLLFLNELEENLAIYHLVFLLKLSRYLGFAPENVNSNAAFYDYKEGIAINAFPHHKFYMNQTDFQTCIILLEANFSNLQAVKIDTAQRDRILNALLSLYEIHILNFNSLNSYPILKEVFSI
jgi:DNA repair protein RecO (recombination protein O)